MIRSSIWAASTSFVSLALLFALAASADEKSPKQRGRAEFEQYCASCHGLNADGKGPMAAELNVQPADLRLLSTRYGKPLPRPKLVAFIDGREMVRGHGSREMPVWGKQLQAENTGSQAREGHVRGSILVIIDYLDTIQIEAASKASSPDPS